MKVFHAILISSQLSLFGELATPLREVNIGLIMSVRMEQSDFHRTDFRAIDYLGFLLQSVQLQFWLNLKNKKYLHEDVQNYSENSDDQSTTFVRDRWEI